jgi:hypothetical protein
VVQMTSDAPDPCAAMAADGSSAWISSANTANAAAMGRSPSGRVAI